MYYITYNIIQYNIAYITHDAYHILYTTYYNIFSILYINLMHTHMMHVNTRYMYYICACMHEQQNTICVISVFPRRSKCSYICILNCYSTT